jgi:hypothetical protein
MTEEIPVDILYDQPAVQQLLSKIEKLESMDLEKDVKLPFVIKDKVLMSPGVWNGYFYSSQAIRNAFLKTPWDKKEIRSLFNDHEDLRSREWIGEVRNQRLNGDDVVGDLYIVDKSTAMKLAYGAKMGISPKVSGHEESGAMRSFMFDNFSVVINPAVKTAYINNQQKNTEVCKMPKKEIKNEEVEEEMQQSQENSETENAEKAENPKKKYPYPYEEKMSALEAELSAYTDFVKDYMKKNPGASIKDAAKAWEKRKMSESIELSDIMDAIKELKSEVDELKKKKYPEPEEKKMQEEDEESSEDESVENKENLKTETSSEKLSDKDVIIQEMSEKIKSMEAKLNEPDKKTVKTEELSQKGDIDQQMLSFLQGMGPEVL